MNNFILSWWKGRRKQLEALGAILLLLLLLARWQRSGRMVMAAAVIALIALLWRDFAEMLRRYWMGLGKAIGFVTGKILLTLVYVLVVIPISIFARRSGKLTIRLKPGGPTNFRNRSHVYTEKDFLHPW